MSNEINKHQVMIKIKAVSRTKTQKAHYTQESCAITTAKIKMKAMLLAGKLIYHIP